MIFYMKLLATTMKTKIHKKAKPQKELREYIKAANSMQLNEFEELYDVFEENKFEDDNSNEEDKK